ncbi:hypothetical protein ADUPG1_007837, partial [Aduncisulcus paluster]
MDESIATNTDFLAKRLKDSQLECLQLQKTNRLQSEKFYAFQQEFIRLRNEYIKQQQFIKSEKEAFDKMHADNAALKQSLDSKKSLEEKLRQQVKALQTELIDTKTAFEECKDKCSSIDESHSALTEEHEAFKRTIEESTHENTILM